MGFSLGARQSERLSSPLLIQMLFQNSGEPKAGISVTRGSFW